MAKKIIIGGLVVVGIIVLLVAGQWVAGLVAVVSGAALVSGTALSRAVGRVSDEAQSVGESIDAVGSALADMERTRANLASAAKRGTELAVSSASLRNEIEDLDRRIAAARRSGTTELDDMAD